MTIADAYAQYRLLVDETQDAFLRPADFVLRYAVERRAWLKDKSQEKQTEYVRRSLAGFKVTPLVFTTGLDAGIPLSGLGEVAFIRSVTADFPRLPYRAVTPMDDDARAVILADPTRRPSNWYARYSEEGDLLIIYAESVPTRVTVHLWRDLPNPVWTNAQITTLAESSRAVDEIVQRVATGHSLTTGDTTDYQLRVGRETPAREQN